jgi:LacI family transcriptional regulator
MSVRERHQGYRQALEKSGIAYDPSLVLYGDYDRVFGRCALDNLLALPMPPSAIFAASDYLALGLLDGLRAKGLRAPESLSLVGFDDAIYADLITPRLSTIRQSARDLGRTAVELLIKLFNEDISVQPVTRIPVEWIPRDSISQR